MQALLPLGRGHFTPSSRPPAKPPPRQRIEADLHQRQQDAKPDVTWHVAMRPGLRRKLNPFIEPDFVAERVEKMKASIRAKVEHPFRVIKRQFGFTKVRYRGLAKNTAQVITLFALSNLWMARRALASAG